MKLGILGAGQLARMLALSAHPLGIDVVCAGNEEDCAADVAKIVSVNMTDSKAVQAFVDSVDVVTFETENISLNTILSLGDTNKKFNPPVACISIGQDRLNEKEFFNKNGIATAPYHKITSVCELYDCLECMGTPALLKTCQGGYDGKGQFLIKTQDDADTAWAELGDKGVLILESFVDFDFEVSIVAVRGKDGEKRYYPLTENKHMDGILRRSVVPSRAAHLQGIAESISAKIMDSIDYVGVLAIEFFVTSTDSGTPDTLIANEMAPRVHNSGHWTMDGAVTGQFENHVRAVMGLPLGDTDFVPTIMLNCIGTIPDAGQVLDHNTTKFHNYNKSPRPGRKLGHINLVGDPKKTAKQTQSIEKIL